MNTFLVIIGLSASLLAIAMVGLATTILLKKGGKFPNGSVGKNPKLRAKGLRCEKCDELKACKPVLQKKREEKDQRMQELDKKLNFL